MNAGLATQPKRWTYEDYRALPDDARYEVIDGDLLPMAPGPDVPHQDWVINLATLLKPHISARKFGKLVIAPLDVILDEGNVVQPDLAFVSAARREIVQRRGIFGAPDLVIEVLSAFSVRRDRQQKMELYARFGVKELWIVDPGNSSVEVFALNLGIYELASSAVERGKVVSKVLDLEFEIAAVAPEAE